MEGRYQAYPEYKDSGVEWIGDIPERWGVLRGKYTFREYGERSKCGDETLLSVSEYYGVKPREDVIDEGEFLSRAESLVGYKKCDKNDLVMNIMLAWKRGLGVTDYDGIVSPAYSVFRFNGNVVPSYMHYLLRTDMYTGHFKTRSTGVIDSRLRLYPESFGNVVILVPPVLEQKNIANFLDNETTKIDTLIEKQQQLISLLKEKRQVVISHAVTKGLNPDAPMKDSGVEWLGKVPEHWVVKSLRYVGDCQNGINIEAEFFGSGYPFVSYGDVYNNRVLPKEVAGLVQSSEVDRESYSVKAGDVFFTRTSETIEEIGFASTCLHTIDCASFAGFLIRFRPRGRMLCSNFSNHYFSNSLLRAFFIKEMNLVTRASLSQDLLKRLPVLLPPCEEQKVIGKYLDEKVTIYSNLVSKSYRVIDFLQERRTALISAAVTGKIDVRNWQPPTETQADEATP